MKIAVRASYLLTFVWTLLFAAVFFPCLSEPFLITFGDGAAVIENTSIRSLDLASVWKFFTGFEGDTYRPLTNLFYAVEFHFLRFYAPAYHGTHLLLHWINTLLIFLFLCKAGLSRTFAALATLALDIHPMRAESAIWIAQLNNLLSSFFCLLSLLSYQLFQKGNRRRWMLGSFVAFIAACLSDAAFSIGLPFVLVALDWRAPLGRRTKILSKLPFFAVTLAVFFFGVSQTLRSGALFDGVNLVFLGYSLIYHAAMFFVPVMLSSFHPRPVMDGSMIIAAGLAVVLGVLIWRMRRKHPDLFFGAFFFTVLFAPKAMSHLWIGQASFFSDHDSYLPAVGLIFLSASYLNKVVSDSKTRRALLIIVYSAWVLWLSWVTMARTATFKSDIHIWADVLKSYPRSETALFGRGRAHFLARRYDESIADFEGALRENPDNVMARLHIGDAQLRAGKSDAAEQTFAQIADRFPDNAESWSRLGELEMARGKGAAAKIKFETALSKDPKNWRAHTGLGGLAMQAEDLETALVELGKATDMHPASVLPYVRSFVVHTLLGRKEEAARHFQNVLKWEEDGEVIVAMFREEFKRAGSQEAGS